VAKLEWGTKRICTSCAARFYDLKRDPIVCPKCGAFFEPEQLVRLKRSRSAPEPKKVEPAKAEATGDEAIEATADDAEAEDVGDDDEDDDNVLEDASDLSGGDDLDVIVDGVDKKKSDE
jgi:uncharacterized protein (TIGR02300 family)